jgi:hypothetical protein
MVRSTGIMIVIRPEDKYEPIDEGLIDDDEEEERWGPWR